MGAVFLAKKWDLPEVRKKSIADANREVAKKSAVEKVVLAKRYGVGKWLMEGYCALVSRKEPITDQEREVLGWETYGRLLKVRELGRLAALERPTSEQPPLADLTSSINCSKACQSRHIPFCKENLDGSPGQWGRRDCKTCGEFHVPGCYAGVKHCSTSSASQHGLTMKASVFDVWAGFDYGSAVQAEFGACVI